MKIVVFDDNKEDLDELTQTVHLWKSHHNYSDVIVHSYLDMHTLLFSIPDINSYDVFFLDIMTDDDPSSGFRLAERIHQQNRRAFIIFTTNSKEYYESAFEISAFRYMLKPLNKQKIASVLDEVYSRSRLVKNHAFIFQSDRQRMIIDSDQILYLESITTDHRAKLFLTDGSVTEISLSGTRFSSMVIRCKEDGDMPSISLAKYARKSLRCFPSSSSALAFSHNFLAIGRMVTTSSNFSKGVLSR